MRKLKGSRILEMGCGTGSSTVALAEQGAVVTALDIDPASLRVAQTRCQLHGLTARLVEGNTENIADFFPGEQFDFIIFFASLEHMTLGERLQSLSQAWAMLGPGALLVLIETPNRLWNFDFHTSHLPFFEWLPHDLAFLYSRFSPRKPFSDLYRSPGADSSLMFLREGRGLSFHEFDLAVGRVQELDIASCLPLFQRDRSRFKAWRLLWRISAESRFERMLKSMAPQVHRGFFQPMLELAIRKH